MAIVCTSILKKITKQTVLHFALCTKYLIFRFAGCEEGVLLASDVAARGLDFPDVHHVIHYDVGVALL